MCMSYIDRLCAVNLVDPQDRFPRWHHMVARLRCRQTTRPVVLHTTTAVRRICTNHTHMIDACHAQAHNYLMVDTRAHATDTRSLSDLLCVLTINTRTHTGHAESLHITMRNPENTFSSRAKKTNKGSPPPISRPEVSSAPITCYPLPSVVAQSRLRVYRQYMQPTQYSR